MEKIDFKLQHKIEELSSQMKPSNYAQLQVWERFRNKLNEIIDWMDEHDKRDLPLNIERNPPGK